MKMSHQNLVVVLLVSAIVFASQDYACAQTSKVVVDLTNKLGVESQLEVGSVKYGDTLPERLCPSGYFLVELTKGRHVAIPPKVITEGRLSDAKHSVTLASGMKFTGTLMGELVEQKDYSSKTPPRRYSLRSCTLLKVRVTKPKKKATALSKEAQTRWQLMYPVADIKPCVICEPQFGFWYSFGYNAKKMVGFNQYVNEWTTSTRTEKTPSFVIDVAGEQMPATLSDFASVGLKPGKQPTITLVSASGVRTVGQLILKSGKHTAKEWALLAEIDGTGGAILILSAPECKIQKIAEPEN